jgi:uncharacterized membrane protein
MQRLIRSIDVGRPIRQVYDQWTQFEEFPRFMQGVTSVEQIDERTLRWSAHVAGADRTWTALIEEQVPDSHISWYGFGDVDHRGIVSFQEITAASTRVVVMIEYEPTGALEKAADMLGIVGARVEGDLQRFKGFIEGELVATGAWRGTVEQGQVRPGTPSSPDR